MKRFLMSLFGILLFSVLYNGWLVSPLCQDEQLQRSHYKLKNWWDHRWINSKIAEKNGANAVIFHQHVNRGLCNVNKARINFNAEPTPEARASEDGKQIFARTLESSKGIPDFLREKPVQPIFTSNPSREGIGFGLSLIFDIDKARKGELKAETQKGEGCIFTISLT